MEATGDSNRNREVADGSSEVSVRNWVRLRLAPVWRRRNRESDLNRELESHLQLEAEDQVDSGLSPEEASYAARRAFGNTTLVQEDVHAIWSLSWLERFGRDVKYAARSLRKNPFTTILLASFAVAGLVLAVVGIYGVVSFLVAQRRQELAVRIALGASRLTALWFVLKQGLEMATIGAVIGLLGAGAAQRLTSGLLFGVSPLDPLTFAGAAVFLLIAAAIASAIPGAGVLKIDPARTLRQD